MHFLEIKIVLGIECYLFLCLLSINLIYFI